MVVPCYNEEEVLAETAHRLIDKFNSLTAKGKITDDSRIVFVDDGSKDSTWELIVLLHQQNERIQGIKLSRNCGHQNALFAGLMSVKDDCDAAISMDADLQDDINAIDEMVERWIQGYDIVYGVRNSRKKDTVFKRSTAETYYKALKMMGVEIKYNHADYRLMSAKALNSLAEFKEVNLFLRGIIPMIGYRTTEVCYERGERFAGQSKYPLKKMLTLAWNGISSFSIKPIHFIVFLGLTVFVISFLILIGLLIFHFAGVANLDWGAVLASIWGLGGLELFAIGLIGEYIGKISLETKHRPLYIIDEYLK